MTNNKPIKSTEDIMFEDVDDYNRITFGQAALRELKEANNQKIENTEIVEKQCEKYREAFRNYYYATQVLMDSKNADFFEDAIKEVHSSVKIKAPAKNILRLTNKVFVQQLAETCFEIMQKNGGEDIDQDTVAQAYRLMEKRKAKLTSFGKLFKTAF